MENNKVLAKKDGANAVGSGGWLDSVFKRCASALGVEKKDFRFVVIYMVITLIFSGFSFWRVYRQNLERKTETHEHEPTAAPQRE